ncbi:MAG: hypothetical protein M0T79_06105 [Actinomycetota bacterium]|nr:hypothetical protein [Actinomycetota bacterium]
MIAGPVMALERRRRISVIVALLGAASLVLAMTAIIASSRSTPQLRVATDRGARGEPGQLGGGALVPAGDLVSDPVFVSSSIGFALETPDRGNLAIERLASSDDGGRTWHVTGSPFPVQWGFSALQFTSRDRGYVFGSSGLLDTADGGRSWHQVTGLSGALERVVPLGTDVWATYTSCPAPGVQSGCSVGVAVSSDGGGRWHDLSPPGISQARTGGDVLARWSLDAAYLLSYGPTGGGLAYTGDNGRTWVHLADPCSGPYMREDLAAPPAPPGSASGLWLVCGAMTRPGEEGQPKLVYRSYDGARRWVLVAGTGFLSQDTSPVGEIPLSGWVSQLATISSYQAWLGIAGLGVIVSGDSGATWAPVVSIPLSQPVTEVGVTFNTSMLGWAIVFRRGVWRTDNAMSWALIDGS